MITKKASTKSVKVTFELPAERVESSAAVVGSFNGWDAQKGLMKYDKKKGVWTASVSLKPGELVEFRYLVDSDKWINEEQADGTVATPFFSENSVLAL